MAQKRFVFDDEKETVQTQQSLSQIDQYENYKHSEEKKIIDKCSFFQSRFVKNIIFIQRLC